MTLQRQEKLQEDAKHLFSHHLVTAYIEALSKDIEAAQIYYKELMDRLAPQDEIIDAYWQWIESKALK